MKKLGSLLVLILMFFACKEQLVEKPENLIAQDTMVKILKDMAVVNGAKNTNRELFQDNKINPTTYVFKKYQIDSVQFVLSDRYYASKPDLYEAIYKKIDTLLLIEKTAVSDLKKVNDSIKKAKKSN